MFNSKEKKTAHMVQKLRFLVGHLFKKPHHKLELIFRNSDGLRDVGFLALRFRAALRGPRCGNGALSGCSLTTGFFVVLVEPLFVTLVHKVCETMGKGIPGSFLGRFGSLDVRERVTP